MNVEVNWLAVVQATLSTMVVGSIWYSPKTFAPMWIKLARIDTSKDRGSVWKPIAITALVSLVTAYVLAHVAYLSNQFFQHSFLQDAVMTSFWMWLGFVATRFTTHDAFEGRPFKLTVLNLGCELVTFLVMGAIIGTMGVV